MHWHTQLTSAALVCTLGLGLAEAQTVTISGSGDVGGFISRIDDPFQQTLGAPPDLEAAFPRGQSFSVTLTYDPARVTYDASPGQPDQAYYFGPPIDMSLQLAGHDLSPPAILGDFSSYLTILLDDTGVWSFDSLTNGFILPVMTPAVAGYQVDSVGVELVDLGGEALSELAIPTQVCLAAWPLLEVTVWFSDGSPTKYALSARGEPDRTLDSDGDGIPDGEELALRDTLPALNPCDADSDDDGLPDGVELVNGTSPVSSDTDGDGLPDATDPDPLVPNFSTDALADAVRDAADTVLATPEDAFDAPNANAQRGRRHALANRLQAAANQIEDGNLEEALAILEHVRELVDGLGSPPDVMEDGPAKDMLYAEINALIALVESQLP